MNSSIDNIYKKEPNLGNFKFDQKVAQVFEDMIHRSVPGYQYSLEMIKILGSKYQQKNSNCYDLGCSLGASTLSLTQGLDDPSIHVYGIDSAPEMIKKCEKDQKFKDLNPDIPVHWICKDVRDIEFINASIVLLNFTLQFIPKNQRSSLLKRIASSLLPGGILILSEKIAFKDEDTHLLQAEIHHAFKKQQGYSDLEISRKRAALENVLVPETQEDHYKRLSRSGFKTTTQWFQCFNFVSFISQK
tara:strand:- start:886 stop:1620 length:735 start_codon:yes stop_codon:yes gene_type:complete